MNGQPEGAERWNLEDIRAAFRDAGCQRLYVKPLSKNDDSKKQIYLGGDLSALSVLPFSTPYPSDDPASGAQFADLDFHWLVEHRQLALAPTAKLIVYAAYPEVRLSGVLLRCRRAPAAGLRAYAGEEYPGRLLFLGIRNETQIIALLTVGNAALHREVAMLPPSEMRGIFHAINLVASTSTREALSRRLCEIHRMQWLPAKRLSAGVLVDCKGPNCGGYTLEAALGVSANGLSEPDFLGWEVKQHGVSRFDAPPTGRITLFTPEPQGGVYATEGAEAFVRRYGHADRRGRENRMNFGGIHKCGTRHPTTRLMLTCKGFNSEERKLVDLGGGVELCEADGTVAARWAFVDLLAHWKRKHSAAAFVPCMKRDGSIVYYQFGSMVTFGEGTDFVLLVQAIAAGRVYYDPGIKLEQMHTAHPVAKKRSQFRTEFGDLRALYHRFEEVDVCGATAWQ